MSNNNITYQIDLKVVGKDIIGAVTADIEDLRKVSHREILTPNILELYAIIGVISNALIRSNFSLKKNTSA